VNTHSVTGFTLVPVVAAEDVDGRPTKPPASRGDGSAPGALWMSSSAGAGGSAVAMLAAAGNYVSVSPLCLV
jgi:hypothetical protein